MTRIGFYGAAGTVTGSCYWMESQGNQPWLVDCGLFQGTDAEEGLNQEPLRFNPSKLAGVILTHAHLDHAGRLPLLVRMGFRGPIYLTPATSDLLELGLMDAVKIQKQEGEYDWFGLEEVRQVMAQVRVVGYHQQFTLGGFRCVLWDAGHILGAASVRATEIGSGRMLAFSGDLGNSPQDLIKPTEGIDKADTVIMESTYGDRNHPQEDAGQLMASAVKEVEKSGGTLLIPAFSIERTQEILHLFDHLKREGQIENRTTVFLDSPMGIEATMIFARHREHYNQELLEHSRRDDPFDFPGLIVTRDGKESRQIRQHLGPKVIIAGSGMMSGGRIVGHARDYVSHSSTILLFTGYQADETLGRQIQDGKKQVMIEDKRVEVAASVRSISSLSSHAGQSGLLSWLGNIRGVKRVFLTHGDEGPRSVLRGIIKRKHPSLSVYMPEYGQVIDSGAVD